MPLVTMPPPATSLLYIWETSTGGGFPLRASVPGLAVANLVHISRSRVAQVVVLA